MAVVFILGPSEWDAARGPPMRFSPQSVREGIRDVLRAQGNETILMEEEPDNESEDLVDKFERLLATHNVTDILVYWPPNAKMQTTYDELILLRAKVQRGSIPTIWVFHHESVARIERGIFKVLERGARSRYLEAVARLGVNPVRWSDHADLYRRVDLFLPDRSDIR